MSGSDTVKQCPRCHGPVRVAPGGSAVVPCQSCSFSLRHVFQFCTDCRRECEGSGVGRSCTQSDYALQAALLSTETVGSGSVAECPLFRQCPNCQALLSHTGRGCPSVRCPQCGVSFCYCCQQRDCCCHRTTHMIDECIRAPHIIMERLRAEYFRALQIHAGSSSRAAGLGCAAPGVTNPADQ